MSDDLYQQEIIRHARDESNRGRLDDVDASATVDNPMCGDRVTVDLKLSNGTVAKISHHTRGCVLCNASATLLANLAPGHSKQELDATAAWLRELLSGEPGEQEPPWDELAIFGPVAKHRSRHACVLLPFDALSEALSEDHGST